MNNNFHQLTNKIVKNDIYLRQLYLSNIIDKNEKENIVISLRNGL